MSSEILGYHMRRTELVNKMSSHIDITKWKWSHAAKSTVHIMATKNRINTKKYEAQIGAAVQFRLHAYQRNMVARNIKKHVSGCFITITFMHVVTKKQLFEVKLQLPIVQFSLSSVFS